ncbi:MAG: hypothetical protein U0K42_09380 [Bacteroidales bacterium]|nr:hypothetical protein [Bacteroidales bacterium]
MNIPTASLSLPRRFDRLSDQLEPKPRTLSQSKRPGLLAYL